MKISKTNSEHYQWGQKCDAWHLLNTESLSIIRETMPPGSEEVLHYHHKAQQFFYILSGSATFDIEGETIEVKSDEGFYVKPNKKHKIKNTGANTLHLLVISEPKAHGDRVNV